MLGTGCRASTEKPSPIWTRGDAFLDAIVYAHHQHRGGFENPRNFGDCMKGRIIQTGVLES